MKKIILGLLALILLTLPALAFDPVGKYYVSPPTANDTDATWLLTDVNGRLVTAAGTATGASAQQVQGNIASGATDSGNPVKVGGVINTVQPSNLTTGQRSDVWLGARGQIMMGAVTGTAAADGSTNTTISMFTNPAGGVGWGIGAALQGFNGTTWDRVRMNTAANGGALLVENGPYLVSRKTADGQVKASAGFIHTISIAGITATPTAGLMTVYDSLTETGTVLYAEWVFATDVGHTITLDVPAGTGIFVGFDATLANAQATVSYR